jgi:hypothetical protein
MTHRDQIESAIRERGGSDRAELPKHLLNPQSEYDFDIAMAVWLHDQHPEVTPVYDDVGNLTGWRGIRLRGS